MKSSTIQPTRVGGIPTITALAHYLIHTQRQRTKRCVVVDSTYHRRSFVQLIHGLAPHTKIFEWSEMRSVIDLLRLSHTQWIVTDDAIAQKETLPSPVTLARMSKTIHVGHEYPQQHLHEFFAAAGFVRVPKVSIPGEYALRGEILHVMLDECYRCTWQENIITDIARIDVETGNVRTKKSSLILPSLTIHNTHTILDHLLEKTSIIHWPNTDVIRESYSIILDPLISSAFPDAGYRRPRSYHLQHNELARDVHDMKIDVFTNDTVRTHTLLPHARIHRAQIASYGCIVAQSKEIILTDRDLGIEEQHNRRNRQQLNIQLLQKLIPGDIVVHWIHGIARFAGMAQLPVHDMMQEYFILEYGEGDKIYVPIEQVDRVDKYIGDPNPRIHRLSDVGWHDVIRHVHDHALQTAQELLALHARRSLSHAHPMHASVLEEKIFDHSCPFTLTGDQQKAITEMMGDLEQSQPMDRLLCGDVGFGKTEVALRAAFRVVLNGAQVAMLAPTTILTQQHFDTFHARLNVHGVKVAMLSRWQTVGQQRQVLHDMRRGTIDICIGTHRLLSSDVAFRNLGLMIIDEEQRFGVHAKERLKQLRANVHVLTMTATPIPRTLHLSLAGLRPMSVILTPPQDRKPVTLVIGKHDEAMIQDALRRELSRKGQAYVLSNHVRTIERRKYELEKLVPDARIGIAHGQMPSAQLAAVMHDFDTHVIDILLASTIIENGLDIPRANTLIVEEATHFGLGELYQLKGRVGRSHRQGYAYFFYREDTLTEIARERLLALQETQHLGAGWELAMRDLEIRGVGSILGKEQHGHAVKIGLNLYTRLLHHAVEQLESGNTIIHERDVPIQLPFEARIPVDVISSETERIALYQELAALYDLSSLHARKNTFLQNPRISPNGKLHASMEGLFILLEFKILVATSSIIAIDTLFPPKDAMYLPTRIRITTSDILPLLPHPWERMNDYKTIAELPALGDDWIDNLKNIIMLLQSQD